MTKSFPWQAGMRARCINAGGAEALRHGRLYLVNRVHCSPGVTYLTLAPEISAALGWSAERFIPVVPACDRPRRPRGSGLYPDPRFWEDQGPPGIY